MFQRSCNESYRRLWCDAFSASSCVNLSIVSEATTTSARLTGVVVGLIVTVLSMVGVVVAVRFITLPIGLRPDGAVCEIEEDPGSGPSNSGLEHIDWGLLPERVCVAPPRDDVGPPRAYGAPYTSGPDLLHLLSYPAAIVIGPTIGLLAAFDVQRRQRQREPHEEAGRVV
jgi:hypothetical protein